MGEETPPYAVQSDQEGAARSGPFHQRSEAIEEAQRLADLDHISYNVLDATGEPVALVFPTRP